MIFLKETLRRKILLIMAQEKWQHLKGFLFERPKHSLIVKSERNYIDLLYLYVDSKKTPALRKLLYYLTNPIRANEIKVIQFKIRTSIRVCDDIF